MATVQRLNRHSPSDDELEQVRSKALARLAAMADRDRGHEPAAAMDDETTMHATNGGSQVIDATDGADSATARVDDEERAEAPVGETDPGRPGIVVLGAPPADEAGAVADGPTEPEASDQDAAGSDGSEATDPGATDQGVLFPAPTAIDLESDVDGAGPLVDPIEQVQAEVVGEEGGMTQVEVDRMGSVDTFASTARPPVAVMATTTAVVPPPIGALPAYCPYCATYLDPAPTEDDRCERCKQRFVVRQVDGRTVLLVEAALPVFEAERQRLLDEAQWARERDHWLTLALMSGAPRDRIAKAASEAPTKAKIGGARTLYLTTVDKSFETAARAGRWDDAAQIRYAEALVLFDAAGVPIPRPPADLPKAPVSERKSATTD